MPNTIILKNKNELYELINKKYELYELFNKKHENIMIPLSFVKIYNNYRNYLLDYTFIPLVIIDIIMTYINDEFTIDFYITDVRVTKHGYRSSKAKDNVIRFCKYNYRAVIIGNNISINFQNYIFSYKTTFSFEIGDHDHLRYYNCVNYYGNISDQILLYFCAKHHYNFDASVSKHQSSEYYNNYKKTDDERVQMNNLILPNADEFDNHKLSDLMNNIDRNTNMTNKTIENVYTYYNDKYEIKYTIVNHNMMINLMVIVQLIDTHINNISKQIINENAMKSYKELNDF